MLWLGEPKFIISRLPPTCPCSWEIGLYDKLSRYHLWVHAAMDVGTHFLTWLQVEDNKLETTIFYAYADAVCTYGHPQCLQQSDFAAEHHLIAADILRVRPSPRGSSFIREPPVQRLRYFWRSFWRMWAFYYAGCMQDLEYSGELVVTNPWHIHSLHASFLPVMKACLETFRGVWNLHPVKAGRVMPTHVPAVVFQEPERLRGLVPPPPYEEVVDNLVDRREARGYTQNVAPEVPPLGDIELLTGDLLVAREEAFAASQFTEPPDLYRIHLAITSICRAARRRGVTLADFLDDIRGDQRLWIGRGASMLRMVLGL